MEPNIRAEVQVLVPAQSATLTIANAHLRISARVALGPPSGCRPDTRTEVPVLQSPLHDAVVVELVNVTFVLTEAGANGTLVLNITRAGGSADPAGTRVLHFSNATTVKGRHTVLLPPLSRSMPPDVWSVEPAVDLVHGTV